MRVFDIINLHFSDNTSKKIKYFLKYRLKEPPALNKNNSHVFYLKINKNSDYVLPCVQHWVNIAKEMEAYIYFICDNIKLEKRVLSSILFHNDQFQIINSIKRAPIKHHIDAIASEAWRNAAFAHLTALYHACSNGFQSIWAIDADDTTICESPMRIAEMMKSAEKIAENLNLSGFSLDMWRSRSYGKHWSLGVVLFRNIDQICSEVDKICNKDWFEKYKSLSATLNVDWLFTHFKDSNILKIESFYFEKAYFIHWGNFIRAPLHSYFCYWNDGILHFPIWASVFSSPELSEFKIIDSIKVPCDFSLNDSQMFVNNEITNLKFDTQQNRRLMHLEHFGQKTKYWL